MKTILLFTLLAVSAITAAGQAIRQNGYTGVYKWKDVVQMLRCDKNGKADTNRSAVNSIAGSKFIVYNVIGDTTAVIKLWDYTAYFPHISKPGGKSLTFYDSVAKKNATDSTGYVKYFKAKDKFFIYNFNGSPDEYDNLEAVNANNRYYGKYQTYYLVPLKYISKSAEKSVQIAGSLALGAINFPFKYRLLKGRSDFSGAFNIGAALGYKMPHDSLSKWSMTLPLIAFSITNVNIDSVSATKNQAMLKSTNNFSAISFATGVIAENNKIQIGLFFGFDKISRLNNLQYGWIYQNKPWFSIGFGYSIFSSEKGSKNTDNKQQQ